MAPLIVMVVKKVGFRLTSVFGGVIFSASLFICAYLKTIASLTLVYGVIAGIGMGFMVNSAQFVINVYFDKRRALANGIYFSGAPLGSAISAMILTKILEKYGLKAAFWFESISVIVATLICSLIKEPQLEDNDSQKEVVNKPFQKYTRGKDTINRMQNQSEGQILENNKDLFGETYELISSNKGFVVYQTARFIHYLGVAVPAFHFVPMLTTEWKSLSNDQAALAFSIFGYSNIAGRLATCFLDRISEQATWISACGSFICGLSIAAISLLIGQDIAYIYAASAVFGFCAGPTTTLGALCLVNIVRGNSFAIALGIHMAIYGVATVSGDDIRALNTFYNNFDKQCFP